MAAYTRAAIFLLLRSKMSQLIEKAYFLIGKRDQIKWEDQL